MVGTLEQMFLSFIIIRSNGSANIYLPISGRREENVLLDAENIIFLLSSAFSRFIADFLKSFQYKAKKLGKSRAVFSWCLSKMEDLEMFYSLMLLMMTL